jgi:hypothetical protein
MKRFLLTVSTLSLLSLVSIGCGTSPCEESIDLQIDQCGGDESIRDLAVAICESLDQGEIQTCLDCTNAAADPCTASDTGGACETECTFSFE